MLGSDSSRVIFQGPSDRCPEISLSSPTPQKWSSCHYWEFSRGSRKFFWQLLLISVSKALLSANCQLATVVVPWNTDRTLPQSVLTPAHSSCLTASFSNVANLYRGQLFPRCGVVARGASFSLPGFLTCWEFSTDLWVCQGSDNHDPELGCTSQYKIPSLLSPAVVGLGSPSRPDFLLDGYSLAVFTPQAGLIACEDESQNSWHRAVLTISVSAAKKVSAQSAGRPGGCLPATAPVGRCPQVPGAAPDSASAWV